MRGNLTFSLFSESFELFFVFRSENFDAKRDVKRGWTIASESQVFWALLLSGY